MCCLYLEIEGQSCLVGSVDQGLVKNRQIDLFERMTTKRARKNVLTYFFPHSNVARNLSANDPPKNFRNVLAKLSAFHCHRSYYANPRVG